MTIYTGNLNRGGLKNLNIVFASEAMKSVTIQVVIVCSIRLHMTYRLSKRGVFARSTRTAFILSVKKSCDF